MSYNLFEIVDFELPHGKTIPCARRGSIYVSLGKIEIFAMGKVAEYSAHELRQLQWLKQHRRKEFDEDLNNQTRLKGLKKLKYNYERSQEMYKSIRNIGFIDSVKDVEKIIDSPFRCWYRNNS